MEGLLKLNACLFSHALTPPPFITAKFKKRRFLPTPFLPFPLLAVDWGVFTCLIYGRFFIFSLKKISVWGRAWGLLLRRVCFTEGLLSYGTHSAGLLC